MRLYTSAIQVIILFNAVICGARVVNSKHDFERLSGFYEYEKEQKEFDRQRASDVASIKKQRSDWENRQKKDFLEYKNNKQRRQINQGEGSEVYYKDLSERIQNSRDDEQRRRLFVKERDSHRTMQTKNINLSEMRELDLIEKRPRVDWKKRNLIAGSGAFANSKSSGRFSGSAGGSFSDPPPSEFTGQVPPPPPPDFFDAEPPPPPPGPMDSVFPGGFEDTIPPPIFDDGPEF